MLAESTGPRIDIDFRVEDGLSTRWDEARIGALVRSIVGREQPSGRSYEIGLHLVGDETIRALNADHRATDRATDVLSFPLQASDSAGFVLPPDEPTQLGDVVVSYPTAVEQAADFGHPLEREVAYLVAHGVLHLLGYDHEQPADAGRMRAREEEALQPLGFTR